MDYNIEKDSSDAGWQVDESNVVLANGHIKDVLKEDYMHLSGCDNKRSITG